jgi:hypothetical protein
MYHEVFNTKKNKFDGIKYKLVEQISLFYQFVILKSKR